MGAEDGRNALKTGLGREKEPLVISLATKYGRKKRNYSANPDVNLSRYKALRYQYLGTRNAWRCCPFASRNFTVREIFPAYGLSLHVFTSVATSTSGRDSMRCGKLLPRESLPLPGPSETAPVRVPG